LYNIYIYVYFIQNIIVEHKKTLSDTTRDFIDAYLHQMKKEEIYNTMFTG